MKKKYTAYTQWGENLGGEVGFLELDLWTILSTRMIPDIFKDQDEWSDLLTYLFDIPQRIKSQASNQILPLQMKKE